MRATLAVVMSIMTLGLGSLSAMADAKKCKPGQEYDESSGKCIIIRGS